MQMELRGETFRKNSALFLSAVSELTGLESTWRKGEDMPAFLQILALNACPDY
jgi:hypothetical protein